MAENREKQYDLEERTFIFAKRCKDLVRKLPKSTSNFEYGKQLIRSSGSQAANYIEANEALSKRDFLMRIKISRKEAKESGLWLRLIDVLPEDISEQKSLMQESKELSKIFGAIVEKCK
ncbi:four helix bundle protein [Candidatus Microgenomates bacterium]|nr:four helix bundle protein [Candidatus Microgenomates bacterium]